MGNVKQRFAAILRSSLFKIAAHGAAVNAAGLVVVAAAQILCVPIFLNAWGEKIFGAWIVISAVPSFFVLLDFGVGAAGGNVIIMAAAKGDYERASEMFSALLAFTILCALVLGGLILATIVPVSDWVARIAGMDVGVIRYPLLALALIPSLILVASAFFSALRATGHYILGTWINIVILAAEAAAGIAVVSLGGDPLGVAVAMLLIRLAGTIAFAEILRRTVPWLGWWPTRNGLAQLRTIVWPALASMSVPISLTANLQGLILVISGRGGAEAAAVFSASRTLARLIFQVAQLVPRAVMPEFTHAWAKDDHRQLRRIDRLMTAVLLACVLPGCVIYAVFGQQIVGIWTNWRLRPSNDLVVLLAVACFFHSLWMIRGGLLIAVNRHVTLSSVLLLLTALQLAIAFVLVPVWGPSGAAAAAVCFEVSMCAVALVLGRRMGGKPLEVS